MCNAAEIVTGTEATLVEEDAEFDCNPFIYLSYGAGPVDGINAFRNAPTEFAVVHCARAPTLHAAKTTIDTVTIECAPHAPRRRPSRSRTRAHRAPFTTTIPQDFKTTGTAVGVDV